jgi:hypothetical protein
MDEHVDFQPQSDDSRGGPQVRTKSKYAKGHQQLHGRGAKFVPQSGESQYYHSLTHGLASGVVYLYAIGTPLDGSKKFDRYSCGTYVGDKFFTAPAHFMMDFEECDVELWIKWMGGMICVKTDEYKHQSVPKEDLVLIYIKKSFNQPPSIMNYIIEEDRVFDIMSGTSMDLVRMPDDCLPQTHKMIKVSYAGSFKYFKNGTPLLINQPIAYTGYSHGGFSGSPVCIQSPEGRPLIIGFHSGVEHNDKVAVAIPISQEYIRMLKKQFNDILQPPSTVETVETKTSATFVTESSGFAVEGFPLLVKRLATKFSYPPMKNRIHKGPFYGAFGDPNEYELPARTGPFVNELGEKIVPMFLAMSALKQVPHPVYEFQQNTHDFFDKCYPRILTSYVLEDVEVLNGIKNFPSVSFNSAVGYPLNGVNGTKFPYLYRDHGDGKLHFQPEFKKEYDQTEENLRNGINFDPIFAAMLKMETRDRIKVKEGRTRYFCSSPLLHLLLFRKYFGSFLAYVASMCNKSPIKVGIDAHGDDWINLYTMMVAHDGSIIAGDFKRWDCDLPACVMIAVTKAVNRWYNDGPVNARVRELLMEKVYNAEHIYLGYIYQVFAGVPSGFAGTAVFGSAGNLFIMHDLLANDFHMLDYEFTLAFYGDDNLISTDAPGLRWSDFAPILKKKHGLTYTHGSKKDSDKYDKIEDVTFIGRKFVINMSHCSAPLDIKAVTGMLNWTDAKPAVRDEVALNTCDSFFQELAHFDKETYDNYSDNFLAFVKIKQPHLFDAVSERRHTWITYWRARYVPGKRGGMYHGYKRDTFGMSGIVSADFECQSGTTDRNLDFTERAANDIVMTQQVPLGGYSDAAPVSSFAVDTASVQQPYQHVNMDTHNMNGVIEREYVTGNFTWSTAQAAGTTLAINKFPSYLFAQPFLADKVKDFNYFTAGVEISVRLTTNRFVSGRLLVDWIPYNNDVDNTGMSVYQRSCNPHMLVSANASEAAILRVPFTSPKRALNLHDYFNDELGVMTFTVLNSLVDVSGIVSTVTVIVTSRFVDAKLFLPVDTSVITLGLHKPKMYGEKQTLRQRSHQATYSSEISEDGEDYHTSSVTKNRQSSCRRLPGRYQEIDNEKVQTSNAFVTESGSTRGKTSYSWMGENESYYRNPANMTQSMDDNYRMVKDIGGRYASNELNTISNRVESQMSSAVKGAESEAKSRGGIVSNTLEDSTNLAGDIVDIGLNVMSYPKTFSAALGALAGPAVRTLRTMGLSKPVTLATTQVTKLNPNTDLNYGKGIDTAPLLAMDPQNQISTEPNVAGMSMDEMALNKIMGTPSLVKIVQFLPASTPISLMTLGATDTNFAFCDFIAQNFMFHSGSYKMALYITACSMQAARFVIYVSTDVDADYASTWHQIIEMQGDTNVFYTIPYLEQRVMGQGTNDLWQVYIKVLSWSQPDPAVSAPISINVYKSAGPDFKVGAQQERQFTYESGSTLEEEGCKVSFDFECQSHPREDFAGPFIPIHESATGYCPQNMVIGEEVNTLREIVHRYYPYKKLVATTTSRFYDNNGSDFPTKALGLEMFGLIFRFYRGTIRIREFLRNPTFCTVRFQLDSVDMIGTTTTNVNISQLEFASPYYSNLLFHETFNTVAGEPVLTHTAYGADVFYFKSAGDDFSFHWLKAPPSGLLQPVTSTLNTDGMVGFTAGFT